LIWKSLSEQDKSEIMEKGSKIIEWGSTDYEISKSLIEDGRENLVLRGGKSSLALECPVRLIHAVSDEEVPYSTALSLAEVIESWDVVCTLPKTGCHQLDDEATLYECGRPSMRFSRIVITMICEAQPLVKCKNCPNLN